MILFGPALIKLAHYRKLFEQQGAKSEPMLSFLCNGGSLLAPPARNHPSMFRTLTCLLVFATPATAEPVTLRDVRVIDGDTIGHGGRVVRLVGFDTPETGERARCESERKLGAVAT